MIIKINEESFNIKFCEEQITKEDSTLNFEIIGDYSATYISELIQKEFPVVYTLIDDNGKERSFSGYHNVVSVESFFRNNLLETTTVVALTK